MNKIGHVTFDGIKIRLFDEEEQLFQNPKFQDRKDIGAIPEGEYAFSTKPAAWWRRGNHEIQARGDSSWNPSAMQDYRDDLTRRDPAGMAARQHLFDYSQQEPFSPDMVDEQDLQNLIENMSSVARWRRDLQANNGAIPFDPSPNSYDPEAFAEGFSN